MKSLSLAVFLFLLFAFTAKPSSSSSATAVDPVLDIKYDQSSDDDAVVDHCPKDGQEIEDDKCGSQVRDTENDHLTIDKSYFILAASDSDRGLKLSTCREEKCPPNVAPADNRGSALIFSPQASDSGIVYDSCNLKIKFEESLSACEHLQFLKDECIENARIRLITATGDQNSGSWFRIRKRTGTNTYNIYSCTSQNLCRNVTFLDYKTEKYLGLSPDREFPVKFVKANHKTHQIEQLLPL